MQKNTNYILDQNNKKDKKINYLKIAKYSFYTLVASASILMISECSTICRYAQGHDTDFYKRNNVFLLKKSYTQTIIKPKQESDSLERKVEKIRK